MGCRNFRFGDVETDLSAKMEDGKPVVSVASNRDYTLEIAFGDSLERFQASAASARRNDGV